MAQAGFDDYAGGRSDCSWEGALKAVRAVTRIAISEEMSHFLANALGYGDPLPAFCSTPLGGSRVLMPGWHR